MWAVFIPYIIFLSAESGKQINTHKQQIRMAIADCFIISGPKSSNYPLAGCFGGHSVVVVVVVVGER